MKLKIQSWLVTEVYRRVIVLGHQVWKAEVVIVAELIFLEIPMLPLLLREEEQMKKLIYGLV